MARARFLIAILIFILFIACDINLYVYAECIQRTPRKKV